MQPKDRLFTIFVLWVLSGVSLCAQNLIPKIGPNGDKVICHFPRLSNKIFWFIADYSWYILGLMIGLMFILRGFKTLAQKDSDDDTTGAWRKITIGGGIMAAFSFILVATNFMPGF